MATIAQEPLRSQPTTHAPENSETPRRHSRQSSLGAAKSLPSMLRLPTTQESHVNLAKSQNSISSGTPAKLNQSEVATIADALRRYGTGNSKQRQSARAMASEGNSRPGSGSPGTMSPKQSIPADIPFQRTIMPSNDRSTAEILQSSLGEMLAILRIVDPDGMTTGKRKSAKKPRNNSQSSSTEQMASRAGSKGELRNPTGREGAPTTPSLKDLLALDTVDLSKAWPKALANASEADTKSLDVQNLQKEIWAKMDRNLSSLRSLSEHIGGAKRHADHTENRQNILDSEKYGPKYAEIQLPPVRVLINADNAMLKRYGLIACPAAAEINDDANGKLSVDLRVSERQGRAMIPVYEVNRTQNASRGTWFARKNRVTNLANPGVLEIESDIQNLPPGALEKQRKLELATPNSMHPFTDEEMKIIGRMSSRFKYLHNPRFTLQPKLGILCAPADNFKNHSRCVTSDGRWRMLSTADYSMEVGPLTAKDECVSGIIAIPSSVVFTDYLPHETYSKVLTIKNATANSHRFRVTVQPPYVYSHYFSIVLVHSPLKDDGLVAPGMSCQYRITFSPDSLANYEQVFLVSTESGDTFKVPVVANRDPPILTIPDVLHCGPCRAGYVTTRIWDFTNMGGPGRFVIMRDGQESVSYEEFQKNDQIGKERWSPVVTEPFEISPSHFNLQAGATGQLTVRYSPKSIDPVVEENLERTDQIILKVACDNCQILELPVIGIAQRPQVTISHVRNADGSERSEDALCREGAFDLVLAFGAQNPEAKSICLLTVKNNTMLRLPFKWDVGDNPGEQNQYLPDWSSDGNKHESVWIEPSVGYLAPNNETTFKIFFSPGGVRLYDIIAAMILTSNVPRTSSLSAGLNSDGDDRVALRLQCTGNGTPYDVKVRPAKVNVCGTLFTATPYTTLLHMTNNSVATVAFDWTIEGVDENLMGIEMSQICGEIQSNTCITIQVVMTGYFPGEVSGSLICTTANGTGTPLCVPITATIALYPMSIHFGTDIVDFGLLALGESKSVEIPLVNETNMAWRWSVDGHQKNGEDKDSASHFTYQPSEGIISPNETINVTINFIPTWYQSYRGVLECHILNYGQIDSETNEEVQVTYRLKHTAAITAIEMRAEVQSPQIFIQNPRNHVHCYDGVPFHYSILLRNATLLPVNFEWMKFKDNQSEAVFLPERGTLEGAMSMEITVEVVCKGVDSSKRLLFGCRAEGMVENGGVVGAELVADVYPINVTFQIENPPPDTDTTNGVGFDAFVSASKLQSRPSSSTNSTRPSSALSSFTRRRPHSSMRINFGTECPIFANKVCNLIVRNHSAVTTSFRVWVENYSATEMDDEDTSLGQPSLKAILSDVSTGVAYTSCSPSKSDSTQCVLQATPATKIGFSSRAGQDYISKITEVRRLIQRMHHLLREGRGAAFHPVPSHGVIGPWGEIRVVITSYNNLVGRYTDNLVFEIGDFKDVFPISMGVAGMPVKFSGAQLVAHRKNIPDAIDRVNFGTRILNLNWEGGEEGLAGAAEPFAKVIQVENQTPRDIVLKWRLFIKNSPQLSGDEDALKKQRTPSPPDIAEIIQKENLIESPEIAIFGVSPAVTKIPAFKTIPLRILFRSAAIGCFDGLIVADIGYVQSDGSITYAPSAKAADASQISASDLLQMARLHIQGKCIVPHLELDVGDRIRMKRTTRGVRGGYTSGASPQDAMRTVNASLKNTSDSVCSFQMQALPSARFRVVRADGSNSSQNTTPKFRKLLTLPPPQSPNAKIETFDKSIEDYPVDDELEWFSLKPTQNMLLAIQYLPRRHDGEKSATSPNRTSEENKTNSETLTEDWKKGSSIRQTIVAPQKAVFSSDIDNRPHVKPQSIVANVALLPKMAEPQSSSPPPSIPPQLLPSPLNSGGAAARKCISFADFGGNTAEISRLKGTLATHSAGILRPKGMSRDNGEEVVSATVPDLQVHVPPTYDPPPIATSAHSNGPKESGDGIDSTTIKPSICSHVDPPNSSQEITRSGPQIYTEGELKLTFVNGTVQSFPIIVEEFF